jgi:hypothetical protein
VNKAVGIILCLFGLIGLIWGGVRYKTQVKVLDLGPIHATREETHDIPLPPIVGGVLLLSGVALLIVSKKE